MHPETDLREAVNWIRRHDPPATSSRLGEWLNRLVEEGIISRQPIDKSHIYRGGGR